MIRNGTSSALFVATLFVIPRASAEDLKGYELCAQGPIVELHPDEADWGPESSCSCPRSRTSAPIRGGVMLSSDFFPWLWSQGTGAVVLSVEAFARDLWLHAFDASGHTVMGTDGRGHAQRLGSLSITGRYRVECYIPTPRSPGPVRVVGDR